MAVAVDKAGPLGAGRSVDFATGYVSPSLYHNTSHISGHSGPQRKVTPLTSTKSLGHASSVSSSPVSSRPDKPSRSRAGLAHIDTNMSSYTTTSAVPIATSRSESRLVKLHKRASSGSSIPASPSPLATTTHSRFTTPYTTYEQSHASTPPPASSSSSFKSRPYIRKFSSARDDENQGRLDLSKSTSETNYLSGLGIQDYSTRSASDVTFAHTSRRAAHARTTSGGSQTSVASRSFTPTQPFMHPMHKTPYTPSGQSYASSMNDDEAHESSDVVTDDDILVMQNFRSRRSVSVSSTPQVQPTPLSQTHTAADLGYVPKFNTSLTNLSMKSGRSAKSSKSRLGRPRRDTARSDRGTAPSIRTSTDKAFSFTSRRSEPDPQGRDDRIREKRRQFNEKEASKRHKREREEMKRRETEEMKEERQRRKSEVSQTDRPQLPQPSSGKITGLRKVRKDSEKRSEELRSKSYDDVKPAQLTALPRQDKTSEKTRRSERDEAESSGAWPRFSTWVQTRVLSCGGKDG